MLESGIRIWSKGRLELTIGSLGELKQYERLTLDVLEDLKGATKTLSELPAGFKTEKAGLQLVDGSYANINVIVRYGDNVGGARRTGNMLEDVLGVDRCSSLRDFMTPEQIAAYNKHWIGVAERISDEALDKQITYTKQGGITKPSGGIYRPAKVGMSVDLNTGDIYFGYSGASKFNPSRTV